MSVGRRGFSSSSFFGFLSRQFSGVPGRRSRFRNDKRGGHRRQLPTADSLEPRVLLSALTVSISPGSISENGGTATGTVTRVDADNTSPLTVSLSSNDPTEVSVPATVLIPAGQASATFTITAVDDALLDGTQTALITAAAGGSGDGALDTTYGTSGFANLPNYLMNIDPSIQHIVYQPDGKAIVAGRHPTQTNAWNVIRLTASGTYDVTFGTNGTVTSTFSGDVFPQGIALGPNGQIYVVGRGLGVANHMVARYTSAGVQNLTITASTAIFGLDIVADQSGDGSFYVGGSVADDFAVLKYRSTGAVETNYGVSGIARITRSATSEAGWAMAQQTDGRIVLAGSGANGDFGVVRFNTTGTADTGFGVNGLQTVDFGSSESANSLALSPDGKIVLAGSTNSRSDWAVARLTSSGSLDSTFSGDGKEVLNWGGIEEARAVVVQTDGKIIVGGGAFVTPGQGIERAIARYNVDGTLDTLFDGDGKKTMPTLPLFEEVRGLALQADGNVLALGGYTSAYSVFRLQTSVSFTPGSAAISVTDHETVTVTLSPTSVSENGGQSTGTVRRSNTDNSTELVVSLASGDETAALVPATVTIAAGQASATFIINAVDDSVIDGDQAALIYPSAANYASVGTHLIVQDDDAPRLLLTVNTSNPAAPVFSEGAGDGAATLTITRTGSPEADLSVSLLSSDTTEATIQSTVVIPAGEAFVIVPINAVDDFLDDGSRTVMFTAIALDYQSGLATAIVTDDDVPGVMISPAAGLVTTEAGGTADFFVRLFSQPLTSISVSFRSGDISEGTISASSLTFTPDNWNMPQTITVTGVDDAVADGNISYSILTPAIFSNDASYNGLNPPDVSLTNLDNETAALTLTLSGSTLSESGAPGTLTATVTRNTPTENSLLVTLLSNDPSEATVPSTVVIPANAVSAAFTVAAINDLIVDGTQTVIIAASAFGLLSSSATVSVADDEIAGFSLSPLSPFNVQESGTTGTFDVVLTAAPDSSVALEVTTSDATETMVSTSLLTFTGSNWNIPQTITVTGVDDPIDDGNMPSQIRVSVVDGLSQDEFDTLADQTVGVTTIDDDTAGTTVSPVTGLLVIEGGQTASVSIVLNTQPVADVIIPLENPTADQVTFSTYEFRFTPQNWNTPQTVVLTAIDNFVAEGGFGIGVVPLPAISADPKYNGMSSQGSNGSIIDNDFVGVTVTDASRNTTESGQTATFTVVLRSEPTGTVVIPVVSEDSTEGITSVSSLTFTPANWNVPQTVTIQGVDDAVVDGDPLYYILVGPIGGASDYTAYDPYDPGLRNLDNDVLTLTLSLAALSFSEAGGSTTATVSRNDGDLSQPLTVNLASSDTTEAAVPSTITIPAGQTSASFTIAGIDDTVVDGPQTVSISASAFRYTGASGSVTVTDNDIPNVAPVITSISNSSQTATRRLPGETITVTAGFTDLNLADVHSATINWGDGTSSAGTVSESGGTGTIAGSKSYSLPGIYVVTIQLSDGAGGSASASTAAAVTGARIVSGVVLVVGTNLNDQISMSMSGKSTLKLATNFLPGNGKADFSLTGITRIEIWLNAGNDAASSSNNIKLPIAVIGGAGTDTVIGPLTLLDSTMAEGAVSNQSIPLSVPRLPASAIDQVFGSLIDRNRDHWFWTL